MHVEAQPWLAELRFIAALDIFPVFLGFGGVFVFVGFPLMSSELLRRFREFRFLFVSPCRLSPAQ